MQNFDVLRLEKCRFVLFSAVADIAKKYFADKKLNIRHQTVKIYFLVPKSSTNTCLDCVKNSATNISSLGPFNGANVF
jgi:hypothetical protein